MFTVLISLLTKICGERKTILSAGFSVVRSLVVRKWYIVSNTLFLIHKETPVELPYY